MGFKLYHSNILSKQDRFSDETRVLRRFDDNEMRNENSDPNMVKFQEPRKTGKFTEPISLQ